MRARAIYIVALSPSLLVGLVLTAYQPAMIVLSGESGWREEEEGELLVDFDITTHSTKTQLELLYLS